MSIPASIQKIKENATCCFTKKEIEAGLDSIAKAISDTLGESNPVVLCVMIGGLIPAGNLLLRLDFPLELDYIHATRYDNQARGNPDITWVAKPRVSLKDRSVLIIEDILDGGLTLAAVVEYCQKEGSKNVYTAVLLDKTKVERTLGGIKQADFTALSMEEGFVFGYGMDYKGYLRNEPGIYKAIECSQKHK